MNYVEKAKELIVKWNEEKNTAYDTNCIKNPGRLLKELLEKNSEDTINHFENGLMNCATLDLNFYLKTLKLEPSEKVEETEITSLFDLQEEEPKVVEVEKRVVEKKVIVKTEEVVTDMSELELLVGIREIMNGMKKSKIDKAVKESAEKYLADKQTVKLIEYNGAKNKVSGITHEQFENILAFVSMNEPVMLVGPAGTGKNVICKQVADALGLEFYFSNAVTQEYKLTGFLDAMNRYEETQFFKAFKYGGLFMLDEMDASVPEALIVLNCAIANGYFDFPLHGKVMAHEDFRIIACANTFGTGASAMYVGRNQLDGATLNRFAIIEVDYDSKIEELVATKEDGTVDTDLVDFARAIRNAFDKNGVQHIVSYREIGRINKMVNQAKMNIVTAVKSCLIKGLEVDSIRLAKDRLSELKDNVYYKALNKLI